MKTRAEIAEALETLRTHEQAYGSNDKLAAAIAAFRWVLEDGATVRSNVVRVSPERWGAAKKVTR